MDGVVHSNSMNLVHGIGFVLFLVPDTRVASSFGGNMLSQRVPTSGNTNLSYVESDPTIRHLRRLFK